jgi:3-hydroxyacyl-[acyl-carrier-protein] dehydratase
MLRDDFYKTLVLVQDDSVVTAMLEIYPGHDIFKGHFPGSPVVPGVCMMQMVKEVLETALDKQLFLSKADYMKFLIVVDPRINDVVKIEISFKIVEVSNIDITATLSSGEMVCFKFKGRFIF